MFCGCEEQGPNCSRCHPQTTSRLLPEQDEESTEKASPKFPFASVLDTENPPSSSLKTKSTSGLSSAMARPNPPAEWDVLLSASQKNDSDRIRRLCQQQGIPATHANGVGQSALHIASLWGNVEAVETLLDLGADTNATNHLTAGTPLHMLLQSKKASLERQEAVVDLLLAHGADATMKDQFGCMPVDYLLQQPNIPSDHPLIQKLQPSAPEIVTLVEIGQEAPLISALEGMQQDEASEACNQTYCGETPFTLAAKLFVECAHDDEAADKLPQRWAVLKAIIDAGGKQPYSSGTFALEADSDPVLWTVIDALRMAYKESAPAKTVSLLQMAVVELQKETLENDSRIEKALIEYMARTLHNAARREELDLLQFLCTELKWDVDLENRQGMTALQFAARSGKVAALEILLNELEADPNHKDSNGKTALDAAIANQKMAIIEILKNY